MPAPVLPNIESQEEIGELEENSRPLTEATSPPSGPSGVVIFGPLVQKHSYVCGLIIMMVRFNTNSDI